MCTCIGRGQERNLVPLNVNLNYKVNPHFKKCKKKKKKVSETMVVKPIPFPVIRQRGCQSHSRVQGSPDRLGSLGRKVVRTEIVEGAACCLEEEGSQPWATLPKTLHCPAQDSGGHRVQGTAAAGQHLLQDSTGWRGAVLTAGCGVRQIWAGAQPTPRAGPTGGQKARSLTLLPAPDGDGVLGVHTHSTPAACRWR